jgi:hypothetical protein
LSKKARASLAPAYTPLSLDAFRVLGPEVASVEPVRSAADAQVQAVIERIKAAGGGAIAIVGERARPAIDLAIPPARTATRVIPS